jgi:uncharacterized protein YdaU (DUF1376 family)
VAVTVVAVAVVLYLFWSRQHERAQWQRKRDHQELVVEVQRELHRQHRDMLDRCAELRRALDHQRRTLQYVARRLT